MVEICNCGLIPVVPVQQGRSSAHFSKRSSIDMGQHARAAAAARLVPGGAASLPAPVSHDSAAQVTVCGPGGCFPAPHRPAPLSVPECAPCCAVAGAGAAMAVAADCTSSGAAASASGALPSFTPHGVLHRSSDGGTVVVAAGSSPHLPRVRSRPSLAGNGNNGKVGGDFAGCFDGCGARPLGAWRQHLGAAPWAAAQQGGG